MRSGSWHNKLLKYVVLASAAIFGNEETDHWSSKNGVHGIHGKISDNVVAYRNLGVDYAPMNKQQ